MKKLFLLCILFFCSYNIYGQIIKYSYDQAGNCTSRKIVMVREYYKSDAFNVKIDSSNQMQIKLYPTPVKDILNVSVNNQLEECVTYTLSNLSGQILQQGNIEGGSTGIDMKDYPDGVYILKIVCGSEFAVYKVVKQKYL